MMALMVAILNIFASSLVYVRILPIDKQVDKVNNAEKYKIEEADPKSTTGNSTLFDNFPKIPVKKIVHLKS